MTDDEKTTELPPGTTAADFAKDPSAFTAPAGAKNQALVSSWAQRRVPVQISAVDDASLQDDDDELTFTQCEANAAYIAAANPQAITALLDEIERLRAEVAGVR
jgi:hypothetical protein